MAQRSRAASPGSIADRRRQQRHVPASGNGDVIEPDDGLCAIGSGGTYALAAARALVKHSKLTAKDLAMEAMRIASEICIYTNANFTVEEL